MDWMTYHEQFSHILNAPEGDYLQDDIYQYTKMNQTRTNRWMKNFHLDELTVEHLRLIKETLHWELITEHWCGDAAHITPVVWMMSRENELNHLNIQLRDSDSEIDKYLTNGSKSIPILIVRNSNGDDIFTWGPRPEGAAELFDALRKSNAGFDQLKEELQKWYNKDKGKSVEKEIMLLIRQHILIPATLIPDNFPLLGT